MRGLLRKTFISLASLVIIFGLIIVIGIAIIAYNKGGIDGYAVGLTKADLINPFKSHVEHGTPFVYDSGIIYPAQRVQGKKAPYYIIHPEAK